MRSVRAALYLGIAILSWGGPARGGPLGDLVLQGGFGNARFGAPEPEVSASGGAQTTWAPVRADVMYIFKEGRLAGVQFKTSSLNATSELLADLGQALGKTYTEADYQQPWSASTGLADLRWEGNSTGGGVLMVQAKPQEAPAPAAPASNPTAAPAAPDKAAGPLETLLRQGRFRDVALGASIDSIEGLQPADQIGDLDSYILPEDELRFDGLILSEISYVAQNDKIVAIGLHADAGEDSVRLARTLARYLGDPSQQDANAGSVTWLKAPVEVMMRLQPGGEGSLALVTRVAAQ